MSGLLRGAGLLVAVVVISGCATAPPPPPQPAAELASAHITPASSTQLPTPIVVVHLHPSPDRPGTIVGEWSADLRTRGPRAPVQVTVTREQDKNTVNQTYWRSDTPIDGLPAVGEAGSVHFGLARAAGALTFDGSSDGKTGQGIVRFEPDPSYLSDLQTLYGQTGAERVFDLALCGYDLAYAKALYTVGYRFTLTEALALYLGSIPSDYPVDLHKAGYEFTFSEIMHLYHAGILANFAAELHAGGLQLSSEDLILLNHSGVATDYAVAMRQACNAASVGDLVYLQHADVSADYARQIAAAGYRLNAADLVKLRQASLGAEYIVAMKKAGYTFSADDLLRLNKANVDADYAAGLVDAGHKNLSADDLIVLRQKGMDVEMIRKLRN